MKNNKGWIRVVEVFMAIILIAGVLVFIISQKSFEEKDFSSEIYAKEDFILKKIQLNDALRTEIVSYNGDVPISSLEEGFPPLTLEKINSEISSDIECYTQLCEINTGCFATEIQEDVNKNIYSKAVSIFTNAHLYNPKQIKLFCWQK